MSSEISEVTLSKSVTESDYFNEDLAPTKLSERTWGTGNIAALWVGMAVCVPTYTLGGVLTTYFGLSVIEALFTILLANIVVLIPLTLNAFPGTKFGIPFPVVLRSSFGIVGSNIPCLIRGFVACGWFGIQTMFGGLAIHLFLSSISDGWAQLGGMGEVIGFFAFGALNVFIVIKGSESIKWLETLAAPLLLIVGAGLIWWASDKVSVTEVLATPASRPEDAGFFSYFFAGLTAMVGFWATLSLNIPDFSRYAKSQKAQVTGQIIGLPLTMFMFAALGVLLTSASTTLVGETVSDPVTLIGHIDSPFFVAIAMLLIIVATLSTNTAANVVSPTNDFQNIAPKYINHTRGVLLTGIVGVLLMSWELLKKAGLIESDVSVDSLYSNWLLGYSSLLGPIAGIMIVDYFLIRKQELDVAALYTSSAAYPKVNWAGFVAFLIPVGITLLAITADVLTWFYSYGWFTGSISGAIIYYFAAGKLVNTVNTNVGELAKAS
ncbi:NCS1 family nucleobase:cation symporter-1 [Alteromonas stellipolaris]|uniref:Nitrate reductase n=1 Tax=Alteromonas stellipolaris TaxID=233316 RepID=A0ABM9QGK2_9ALTE|nr:NCS1 family nucleobase:cation symporter-1 [Alteromonas stellipolaris]ALM92362.1 Cytosine/purine/uracil/thiamine/allantoin permease [Alteromonas stellipolaris LMG 21856]AMJ72846.1 nitrate reductase [Alteromonas stellipolaris]